MRRKILITVILIPSKDIVAERSRQYIHITVSVHVGGTNIECIISRNGNFPEGKIAFTFILKPQDPIIIT